MADPVARVLAAGDVLELQCPTGSTPQLKVGEKLLGAATQASPVPEPIFVVLRVNEDKLVLGPMKAGEMILKIPCSGNLNIEAQVSVNLPRMDQMPEREAPLPPLPFAFPLWLWMVLITLVVSGALSSFYIYWKRTHKKKAPKDNTPPPPPPDKALELYLKAAKKNNFNTRELYVQGTEKLRAFLELRLGFDASSETTREFLGVLQAAMVRHRVDNAQLGAWVQSALTQSDNVRFANDNPPADVQASFVKTLGEIFAALPPPKAATEASKP